MTQAQFEAGKRVYKKSVEKGLTLEKEFQDLLANFAEFRRKNIGERVSGQVDPSEKLPTLHTGRPSRAFVKGEVTEPLGRVKLQKGTKLVISEDDPTFEEPIASLKMQKSLRVLELRLDSNGYLYSPKAFNSEWSWQSQAVWLRLIGMGYTAIADRLGRSRETVKSMFGRLNISKFFPPTTKLDWATVGFGAKIGETPSGWRMILHGGSSGMLYPSSEMVIDERTGQMIPRYQARFTMGETLEMRRDGVLETDPFEHDLLQRDIKPFDPKKHGREVKRLTKEAKKRKESVIFEQKERQLENLKRNIEKGFDPETGKYDE